MIEVADNGVRMSESGSRWRSSRSVRWMAGCRGGTRAPAWGWPLRGMAERHGGRIELLSARAAGTRARLNLPRRRILMMAGRFREAGWATG